MSTDTITQEVHICPCGACHKRGVDRYCVHCELDNARDYLAELEAEPYDPYNDIPQVQETIRELEQELVKSNGKWFPENPEMSKSCDIAIAFISSRRMKS